MVNARARVQWGYHPIFFASHAASVKNTSSNALNVMPAIIGVFFLLIFAAGNCCHC